MERVGRLQAVCAHVVQLQHDVKMHMIGPPPLAASRKCSSLDNMSCREASISERQPS